MMRPTKRIVAPKPEDQQAAGVELNVRHLLVPQGSRCMNALRVHLAEFANVAGSELGRVADLIAVVRNAEDGRLPSAARDALQDLAHQIETADGGNRRLEKKLVRRTRTDETARPLATIPGTGAITASALLVTAIDLTAFGSARHFTAWFCLTPRIISSGGKTRKGGISRQGNAMPRRPWFWEPRWSCDTCGRPGDSMNGPLSCSRAGSTEL